MRLPDIWAVCEWCFDNAPERAGHAPDEVYWSPKREQWLCIECWTEMENVGREQDVTPLVYADAVIVPTKEQYERLLTAATKHRLGVK